MKPKDCVRVLFTGYAPVHFTCFRPLNRWLTALDDFDVYVSGGLRTRTEAGTSYDLDALYEPFQVPRGRTLPVERLDEMDFDVLFAANSKLILPRSVASRVQIFHGVSFRNLAIREQNMMCDHYFVVGPYMLRSFERAGLFDEGDSRVERIGFMKTDRLLNGELDRSALLEEWGFDGTRPVLLYAPTGAKHNSLETMGEDVVDNLRATQRYDLIVKLHDHPKDASIDWPARLQARADDHFKIAPAHLDVVPLMFLSDLLLSDASSVSSEYALLDRPMVFLDVPKLIEKARAREGSMVDTETWGRRCGTVVESPEGVVAAVEDALLNPARESDLRRAMAEDLFFNPGRATEHAAAWVVDNLCGVA